MLTGFINLPLPWRLLLVAMGATLVARCINWAIYNWAYHQRKLGPWTPGLRGKRVWLDHLPVLGWHRLRGEATQLGAGYWIRPLLIELLFPIAITWYYWNYTNGSLSLGAVAKMLTPALQPQLHCQFIGQFILLALMAVATFIDFDEQSIPDYVTVPGTVIGLAGSALAPTWLPFHVAGGRAVELQANIPSRWETWLDGTPGLMFGLLIVLVWGFALLDRRWIGRRGFSKGVQFFFARMFRYKKFWISIFVTTAVVMLGVGICWLCLNPGRWTYVLSSLFGLAFAGGITWGVRISASVGLGVEALGFGDVTLMAMIGTYIGWQPSLLVFFIAPLVAILFVLVRWMLTGETATPYGPYLCAAVVLLLIQWDDLWNLWAAPVFALGPTILGIVVACVALMGTMLWIWRLIKQALGLAGH